jgi:hypothetical protein
MQAMAHVNPLRAPPVKTSTGQALALRALFIKLDAQNWTSAQRNLWYKELLLEELFSNLNVTHVRYQWIKFHGESVLKLQVGHAFSRASKTMAQRYNVVEIIFDVLSKERELFSGLPSPEYAIPTGMLDLMDRCVLVEAALAVGGNPEDILIEGDLDKINSLVTYGQGLIMTYSDMWERFSIMELNPTVVVSTRPDLAVADLELNLLKERYNHGLLSCSV